MKIRIKMMLWYTLLTSILLIVFIPVLYNSIVDSLYNEAKSALRSTIAAAEAGVEYENNTVSWDENMTIAADMPTFIYNRDNQMIYSNSQMTLPGSLLFQNGLMRKETVDGSRWLIIDETIQKEGTGVASIRVLYNLNSLNATLNRILIIIALFIPVYLIVTVAGGLLIAKRALLPITRITKTAKSIGKGNLSSRIMGNDSKDEVGELSNTFNEMLERLEDSFYKEKRFASDASHELRTPVSIIMAYSETLLSEADVQRDSDNLKKSLQIIHKESERMNTIISQLLKLTRGYEGRLQIVKESFDISSVIENVLEELEEMAIQSKIQLIYKNHEAVSIEADQSLITQMVINFVENAIKYGVENGHVWVSTVQRDDEIILIFEDDGIGIDEEQQKHIFERFYRADQARDRSGTGLGLSIVKWILEEHEGKIEVSSKLNGGTTFEVRLPRRTL